MRRQFQFVLPIAVVLSSFVGHAQAEDTNYPQLIPGSGTKDLCQVASAESCIGHVWRNMDSDGDDNLSAQEMDDFIAHVERWSKFTDRSLADRTVVRLAMTVYQVAGPDRFISAYDADDDGMLSKDEALADLHLDERPIAELLLDGNALDGESLANRFGFLAPQLARMAQSVGSTFTGGGAPTAVAGIPAEQDEQIGEAQ